ncbi:MAG: hypothetical protein ABFS39_13715 [Pseudomonadota bacterium]
MTADPGEALAFLKQLDTLLAMDDSSANSLFFDSEKLLTATFGAQIEALGRSIEVFDYPGALIIVSRLLQQKEH